MLSVSEAAAIFKVTPHTIRSWDNKGILKPDYISPTGRRFYSKEKVETLRKEGYCK